MKKIILSSALSLAVVMGAFAQGDELVKYYDNGNLKEEATQVGDQEFKVVTYHENGKLKSERYVKDQELNGTWMAYDPEGNIVAIRQYEDGRKAGRWMVKPSNSDHQFITVYNGEGEIVRSEKMDAFGNVVASR